MDSEGFYSLLWHRITSMESDASVKEPLAVFDVDGTLFRRGLLPALTRRLVNVEVEAHGRRLHIYTRDLAQRLKQAGYYLIAISGSPTDILETFLNPLGFDRAWGTVLGQEEGRYTGQLLYHPFSDKRGVLEGFLEEASLKLDGSVGVGDTLSDVGFLELVQTPIVFNPNRRLFEVARQQDWPIVVERKDVIYNLRMRLKDSLLGEGTVWVG